MTNEEWRNRVGRWVEQQRGPRSIRSIADQAGISEGLWRQIESGVRPLRNGQSETVNPKPSTRAAVSEALGFRRDSIDRLLAGEKPVAAKPAGATSAARRSDLDVLAVRVARLQQEVAGLVDLAEVRAAKFDALVEVTLPELMARVRRLEDPGNSQASSAGQ